MRRCWRREEIQESQGPRGQRSRGPKVPDISNSHSNTSLTLKKVHLVYFSFVCYCKVAFATEKAKLLSNFVAKVAVNFRDVIK